MVRTQLSLIDPRSSSKPAFSRYHPLFVEMQKRIAEQLHQSGHFSSIEIGFTFPRQKTHLNFARSHHIYAVRKQEYRGDGQPHTYLVFPSVIPLGSVPALREKLNHLAERDVAVCPVLMEGMSEGYMQPAYGAVRTSLWRLSHGQQARVRVMTREEMYWNQVTQGNVPYANPVSPSLRILDLSASVKADYSRSAPAAGTPREILPVSSVLKTIRDPQQVRTCSAFTLQLLSKYENTAVATPVSPQRYERELAVENLVYSNLRNGVTDMENLEERVAIQLEPPRDTPSADLPYDFKQIVARMQSRVL